MSVRQSGPTLTWRVTAFLLTALACAAAVPASNGKIAAVAGATKQRSNEKSTAEKPEAVDPCASTKAIPPAIQPGEGRLALVTGGAGFIGSTLVEMLRGHGYRVRVLDDLSTGDARYLNGTDPGLEFQFGDIRSYSACQKAVAGAQVVFHLAAMSKVAPSLKNVQMGRFCEDVNVLGTFNVLQAALEAKTVQKVVYAASSTYYGNLPAPHVETMLPDPQTPYASSKYEGEVLMNMFNRVYNLPTLNLRFFMVYGPRQPSSGPYAIVTGKFIERLQRSEPLLIEGDGMQTRDFIHVEDIARGLILGAQSEVRGETINLGSGRDFSVRYCADLVSNNSMHVAPRPLDMRQTLADTCKAKSLLSFATEKDFTASMRELIDAAMSGKDFRHMRGVSPGIAAYQHLTGISAVVAGCMLLGVGVLAVRFFMRRQKVSVWAA